ncbi:transmembrane protein 45B-like [Juglans microcarpa x Juglans regia]|uniref:transmembrane protein 45B-like n=1 Tax=Juglans microcarpa x Juglans regia TaxID=2249226 RepID=UPI001B7D9AA9|nr:transmembrane protein 45B-like [Juglans microcarpa x Juglans regia]
MGTLVGHVAPGFGFFIIGLWHLFNHIKLHAQYPNAYTSPPWFPTTKLKYLELFLIMGGCSASIAMELFIGPERHQPFDPDGTIPSNHLHNFEHSSISMTFFVYAAFAIVLDRIGTKAQLGLTQLLGAIAFAQQLLLFHLHSADHMGPEGQYHMLLQIVIFVSLATTLIGIGLPKSFLVSFVRSTSILFQGIWLMVMGFVLWTPELISKGCFMHLEEGHKVVRCSGNETLHRAKALVNIQFSWFLILITIFAACFYLILVKAYGEKPEYVSLTKEEDEEEVADDVESQKKSKFGNSKSFIQMGKAFSLSDMER